MLIFDSNLTVTEHNRIQLFIKYDRLSGRSFHIDRCHGHDKSVPMYIKGSRPKQVKVGSDVLLYTRKRVCFTYFAGGRKVGTHFQSYRIVLVLIFDSKLSVTEHNRIQLFIKYDRLRGRSFLHRSLYITAITSRFRCTTIHKEESLFHLFCRRKEGRYSFPKLSHCTR